MLEHAPPSRLTILEKGGRLVVVDRLTGAPPATAAERMAIWDAQHASQIAPAPSPAHSVVHNSATAADRPQSLNSAARNTPSPFAATARSSPSENPAPSLSVQQKPSPSPQMDRRTDGRAERAQTGPKSSKTSSPFGTAQHGLVALFIMMFLFPLIGGFTILLSIAYFVIAVGFSQANLGAELKKILNEHTKKDGR